jgi:uncharacterized protein (TIGR02145 family)
MKQLTFLIAIIIISGLSLKAQVAVTTDGSSADPSAMLDVKSTEKGFLLPRMNQIERDAIPSPAAGLVVWCTNCGNNGEMQVYNGTAWTNMTGGTTDIICGNDFTDIRDGKTYGSVLIGTQCWMAENLNVGNLIFKNITQGITGLIEKYCYDNSESNCDIYGGLYQWNAMMQYTTIEGVKGICPEGWHLPTDGELTLLTTFLGGENVAGGKIKETGTLLWNPPNTGATNSSGFTALPAGFAATSGFGNITLSSNFWSSTQITGSSAAIDRGLEFSNASFFKFTQHLKTVAYSVRCIKNN